MKIITITWTVDHPSVQFSSRSGVDADGNKYRENACREIVTCETPSGGYGEGWTATQALAEAKANEAKGVPA